MNKIEAKEGYTFVRNYDNGVCGKTMYLADEDNISNYSEIADSELISLENKDSVKSAIEKKIAEIDVYDNSDAVNSFTFNGITLWFSSETRAGFKNSIESASLLGETTISIPTTAGVINLPLNDAKIMLAKIQRYADACYLVTMQHKQEVAKLTNITDVEAYDITKGYPDKLTF